jgi:hypothetical protein
MSRSLELKPNSRATSVKDGDSPFNGADRQAAVKQRHSSLPSCFLNELDFAVAVLLISAMMIGLGQTKLNLMVFAMMISVSVHQK